MSDKKLRSQLIRLAHAKPELRPHLLPLLKKASHADVFDFAQAVRDRFMSEGYGAEAEIVGETHTITMEVKGVADDAEVGQPTAELRLELSPNLSEVNLLLIRRMWPSGYEEEEKKFRNPREAAHWVASFLTP